MLKCIKCIKSIVGVLNAYRVNSESWLLCSVRGGPASAAFFTGLGDLATSAHAQGDISDVIGLKNSLMFLRFHFSDCFCCC